MTRRHFCGVVMVAALLGGCRARPAPDLQRLAALQATYDDLHGRLERASKAEPIVAAAVAARGQVVVAMRAHLVEVLAASLARRYLDQVTLDLADVEARASGEMRRKTPLGHIKLGDWNVTVVVGDLKGRLRAGVPEVGLRSPALVDLSLPVDVRETVGDAALHFTWDSAALANVVCRDFALDRDVEGRVVAQRHVLSGTLQLQNTGAAVTATPLFPERRIRLRLDLTPRSWDTVGEALRSQDTFARCGVLMDPDKGLDHLKRLASRGVWVKLPDAMFRTVNLPARLHTSVKVNEHTVALQLTAESLRVQSASLWSSVSVRVRGGAEPPRATASAR